MGRISDAIIRLFGDKGNRTFSTWMSDYFTSNISRRSMLLKYETLVYACVTAIADDVGGINIVFKKKSANKEIILADHPFKRILDNPHLGMTTFELFEAHQSYIELTGESFLYFALGENSKLPKEAYILRPDKMDVATNDNGDVIGYVYHTDMGTEVPLEVYEVGHQKHFNPTNQYRGLGTLQAGLLYIDTENETSKFQYNFMKNQASPSGVMSLMGNIGKEAFSKVKKVWKEQQAGAENAGKTLFLRDIDAKFTKIGLSIGDINMAELKNMTEERVFKMFRVPKALLGETDVNGLGRANIDTIEYIFAKRVIDPKMKRIADFLNMLLHRFYPQDKDVYITYTSPVSEDRSEMVKEWQAGVDIWIKRNEIRAKENLPPVDGGDDLYLSFNQVAINSNTQKSSVGKAIIKRIVDVKDVKVKDTRNDQFISALDKNEEHINTVYKQKLRPLLFAQQERVIAAIYSNSTKDIVRDNSGIEPDPEEEAKKAAEIIVPILLLGMMNSGKTAIGFLTSDNIEFFLNEATKNAIQESTKRLLKSFTEQTVKDIQHELVEGIKLGESSQELAKRIESVYKEATGYRARRIATTEAHKASNAAVSDAYQQMGYKQVKWVARAGACQFCLSLDGTITTIGVPFISKGNTVNGKEGGEYLNDYSDVEYADLHPNCRCILVPVEDTKAKDVSELNKYKKLYEEEKQLNEEIEKIIAE